MKKIIFLLSLMTVSFSLFSEEIPGIGLLNAFSSQCKSQGEWVRSALSDSIALMNTLKAVANDPDCKSVAGAMSELGNLQVTINNYKSLESSQIEIAALEGQEQELLSSLAQTSDPQIISEINSNLRSILAQKANLVGKQNSTKLSTAPKYGAVMNQMVAQTNTALKQVISNQACLFKRPAAISTAFSLGASVSAQALSSSSPILGLGLAAGSDLLGMVIDMANKMKLNRKLKKMSASTVALEAYKCALESMGQKWCLMQDAEKFINLKSRLRHEANKSELLYALTMNDRDIPVFLNWLDAIRIGAPPSRVADSRSLETVYYRDATLKSKLAKFQGLYLQNKSLFEDSPTNQDKWPVIRSVIISLLDLESENTGPSNPLFDIFSKELGAYYLLGFDTIPTNPIAGSIPFLSFNPFDINHYPEGNFVPNYPLMETRFDLWFARGRSRVDRELSLVLQPDALRAIVSAFDQTDGRIKLSPHHALENIIDFMEKNIPQKWLGNSFSSVYKDQIIHMKKIKKVIDDLSNSEKPDAKRAISEIYNEAELQFGTAVFKGRLDMTIRLAIQEAIRTSELRDQNIISQFLAANRFTDILNKHGAFEDLSATMADIKRARPLVLANLTNFSNLFSKNIKNSLEILKEQERKVDVSISGDFNYSRAELCFGLLSVPVWPKNISKNLCKQVSIRPLISGAPHSKVITENLMNAPYNQRACLQRDFMRSSKIYQDWGIKL